MILLFSVMAANAQVYDDDEEEGSGKPKIRGQRDLSTDEEKPITIEMTDIEVEDKDDLLYPVGFTMRLYPGENYTFSDRTVTPSKNFTGKLTVPITVSDGENDSEKFDLKITVDNVNDPPVIKSQAQSIGTMAGVGVTLQLNYLNVDDPDDSYPGDFTLKVLAGSNYSVSGNTVTPNEEYAGSLNVGVRVNDGNADSEAFNFVIEVSARSNKAVITNQSPVIIKEDESFTIELSHLVVDDPQNKYPQGFKLDVMAGDNYTLEGTKVIPTPNYHGDLVVPLTITAGQEESDVFNFRITVRSVNDPPVLTLADTSAIRVRFGDAPVSLLSPLSITDMDHDSLTLAEISFVEGLYVEGTDILVYLNNTPGITSVYDTHRGILALVGPASLDAYITALSSVTYQLGAEETSGRTNTGVRLTVSDGQSNSKRVLKPISFSDLISGSFEIPTGFTPNGDAVNDTWSIRPLDNTQNYDGAIVRVYSKAGLLVFEGTGISTEWDGRYNGTMLPPDVYFYTVDFNLMNQKANLKGIVTLLR